MHAFEIANSLNINDYSAIVAVGGDGTLHEVVNGMLHRADKAKVPVGFVPNGSGNDMCAALMIKDLDKALDYLIKGDIFKMDIIKVLIDHESEAEITSEKKTDFLRYEINNNDFGLSSRASYTA